jgi:hypothetical protein
MVDILVYLPVKRKKTASGWISFDAVCCAHNGERPDRRQRGGVKIADTGWSYHCFNCGYKASFILGRNLSFKARRLLEWLGVPAEEIERANLESLRYRSVQGILDDRQRTENALQGIRFEDRDCPYIDLVTAEHHEHWQYLRDRCVPEDYPCMLAVSYDRRGLTGILGRTAVVIPFTYDNRMVGHAIRFLDDRAPKYIHDIQPGYVFGTDLQHPDWQHVLVMEGVFDALSISGLAVLHAEINDAQARLIRSLDRNITVVPDQDAAGMKLVDRALELGWAVSMPDWPEDCKDVNDVVKSLGKLATLITIMQARETSRIKIELRKKQIVKKIPGR